MFQWNCPQPDYIAVFIPAGLMWKVSPESRNEAGKYWIAFCQFPRLNERELADFDCKHELFCLFLPWTCLCWVYWVAVPVPTLRVFPCSGGFLMMQLSAANGLMLPRPSTTCMGVISLLCSPPSQEMELPLIFGSGQSSRQICLFT